MKFSSRSVRTLILFVSLMMFPAGFALGELSTDVSGSGGIGSILMHITDGPDPIGSLGWQQIRSIPPAQVLNDGGAGRGDGRPDIAYGPGNGAPLVTWAYQTGIDFDIAFSEGTGGSWSTVEFLTSDLTDELDPRLFVEPDGTVHVVWWVDGAVDHVWLSTRPAGSMTWTVPVQVTSGPDGGRRPAVVMFEGVLRVACERASGSPDMEQEIVVRRREPGGAFATEIVARTLRTGRLDAVLHAESGKMWIDWKNDDGTFGYSESGPGGWMTPAGLPWTDLSWVGVEDARRRVRGAVLGP